MKILFDHPLPFFLAHGGFETQIDQTKSALNRLGVEVEAVQWWNPEQKGDVIHFFGRPAGGYIRFAQSKGFKVVIAELLTGLASRSTGARLAQRVLVRGASALLPKDFTARMAWDSYKIADACIALTQWEALLMQRMFGAPAARLHVIPNGVEAVFSSAEPQERGKWLVCTATITERKRVLETAQAAVSAKTPLWIIGRPYSEHDSYWREFRKFAEAHPENIRYQGEISDRSALARIYREARGFVLLSTGESLSLSSLEAAACQCPLLLRDLPWARTTFGDSASYCPVSTSVAREARCIRQFYDTEPKLLPTAPKTWDEVALQLKTLYESLLNSSR